MLSNNQCPVCNGPNHCALAADPLAATCWCQRVDVVPDLAAATAPGPERWRCLCPACLRRRRDSARAG